MPRRLRRFVPPVLATAIAALSTAALADAWPTAPLARDDSDREHNRRWQQFQETLRRTDAAIHAITSGNPQPYIALWANSPDVTLFGAWGPIERGPDALRATFEWVGGRFGPAGGLESEHEVVQMSGSLAYTVGFERGLAQVDGRPPAPMTIRVTHMFRYERGQWKLMHRHADFPPSNQRPS